MDFYQASQNLFEMDLVIQTEHLLVDVIWCRVMKKEKPWYIDHHKHHSFEFHICQSGSSLISIHDEEVLLKENQMLITGPGVVHAQGPGTTDDYVEYALNCNITLLSEESSEGMVLLSALQNNNVQLFSADSILPLFESILEEAEKKPLGYYNKIKCLLNLLLIESSRLIYKEYGSYDVPKKMTVHDKRYHMIYRYIQEHIREINKVEDLNKVLHLSAKQINRIVYANAIMTTKQLINELKFNLIKDYLLNTDWSIQEISDEMNFSSVHYLNEFFKRYEKLPPSHYRKMSKNLK